MSSLLMVFQSIKIEFSLKDFAENHLGFKTIALRYFNPIEAHPSGLLWEDSTDAAPNDLMPYLLRVAQNQLPCLRVFRNDYQTPDGTGIRDYIRVVDFAQGHVASVDYLIGLLDRSKPLMLALAEDTQS